MVKNLSQTSRTGITRNSAKSVTSCGLIRYENRYVLKARIFEKVAVIGALLGVIGHENEHFG